MYLLFEEKVENFQIGDWVRVTASILSPSIQNSVGKVRAFMPESELVGVEFFSEISWGCTLNGALKKSRGAWFKESEIVSLEGHILEWLKVGWY